MLFFGGGVLHPPHPPVVPALYWSDEINQIISPDLGPSSDTLNPVPPVKDARGNEGGTVDRSNEFEFPVL
jgi:hypothetical protein